MWRDIRPSSSDYNIGKLKVSWYKLVIRHAQASQETYVVVFGLLPHVANTPILGSRRPDGRPVRAAEPCNVVELPAVQGLHHIYLPKAA